MFLLRILYSFITYYCFIACLYVTGRPCCKSLCLDIIIIIITDFEAVSFTRAKDTKGALMYQNRLFGG